MTAFLTCTECDADVFPATGEGCLTCGKGTDDGEDPEAHDDGSSCTLEPLWSETDETCPDCGASLHVVADGVRAWVETREWP